ncbi:LytR family transcriptional regulator [Rossellomorea aquimaris]|uniref:Polyisoprenyl-teichoic acid--peptidoglycan teichoic acid transferase TagU n=1 Tax=Rossellomorea aquimaris TaxID=189382 RepID=A0A5D4U7B9_9BACI|nr:LytR family transcriptional regulator [Rossellomorea aquimaris]TYS76399.1 LytR family transcriptional regulator [Rossellomorea aquimaris]TYS82989.1 LytR family transcriptional regulator [Rossellomorea aquimaris]
MRVDKHKRSKKRKWVKVVGILFLLMLLGGGAYAYSIYHSLNSAVETMHSPIEREVSSKRTKEVTFKDKEPFSVLLLGVDERENDKGRSDSMIVLTVNPDTKSVKMISIPRDTLTDIVGHGTRDKINHAYAFGGVEMAMDTVEGLLDIPIDYYAQINMEGFEDIVNAVGGVTVNNDLNFSYGGYSFEEGKLTLSGKEALAFSRMRYEDPRGDFGRQLRQREVIQGVIREGASVSSLWNFDNIFDALGNNVKTNLKFQEMVDIQKHYKSASKDIEQIQIKTGSGTKIDGIYYYVIPEEELSEIQGTLQDHLEL